MSWRVICWAHVASVTGCADNDLLRGRCVTSTPAVPACGNLDGLSGHQPTRGKPALASLVMAYPMLAQLMGPVAETVDFNSGYVTKQVTRSSKLR